MVDSYVGFGSIAPQTPISRRSRDRGIKMSNLTSFDWWIGLYFVASCVAVAFTIGQSLVKLLLLRFANRKRIDDTL